MASILHRTIKGGLGFFSANIISKGLAFLFILFASSLLGAAEFGLLSLGISIVGLARKFSKFGLPTTIQRFLSGEVNQKKSRQYSTVLIIAGIGAFIANILIFVLAPTISAFFHKPQLSGPLRVLSFAVLTGVGFSIYRSVLQAQERIRDIIFVDTIKNASKLGFLVVIFLWLRTASGAAWAVVGSFTLSFLISMWCVRRTDLRPAVLPSFSEIKTTFNYSAMFVLVGFGYFISTHTDRLMIGWLSTSENVGIYTVANYLALVIILLHTASGSIFQPLASEAYRNNQKEDLQKSYLFISKWVGACSGIMLVVFAGAGSFLLQIFGPEFNTQTAHSVLVLLAILMFWKTWVGPTGSLLQMAEGHRVEVINTVFHVVTNIVLNYILILNFGIVGAAIATMCAGVLRNSLQITQIYYWYGIFPSKLENIIILLLTFVLTAFVWFIEMSLIIRLIVTLSGVAAFVGFVLYTAKDHEYRSLKKVLSKLGNFN